MGIKSHLNATTVTRVVGILKLPSGRLESVPREEFLLYLLHPSPNKISFISIYVKRFKLHFK